MISFLDRTSFTQRVKSATKLDALQLLCLKSIGVKFKVFVTDWDKVTDNDAVDGFVQLLQLTPALNVSVAHWTRITMLGIRTHQKTR